MALALAAPALAALLAAAAVDVDVGVRTESRSTVLVPAGAAAIDREALSVSPRAAAAVELGGARAGAEYAPRIWTSDVGRGGDPLVDHTVGARLETRLQAPWRAEASATAMRGRTDPLADAATLAASSTGQLTSTTPLPYESLRAGARAEVQLDQRTTLASSGFWSTSRGRNDAARALLPAQRSAGGDASVAWQATPRSALRLAADGGSSVTTTTTGDVDGAWGTLAARLTHRLQPRLTITAGAGGSVAYDGTPGSRVRLRFLPAGQLGFAQDGEGGTVSVEGTARLLPSVDRVSGRVRTLADAVATVRWRLGTSLTLATTASGGAFTAGDTRYAGGDVRLVWDLRRGLSLEAGAIGRVQQERRPELPSYREAGAVIALAYRGVTRW